MMKVLHNPPVATNLNIWKEKIKRGPRQLSIGTIGKNILPVFEKFHWLATILFFLSSSAVEFSFLSCFYLIERKQFFFFVDLVDYGTSWSLLLGNLILSQASMDQYVCFYLLLFSNFIPFFTFIRLQWTLCFCDYNLLSLLFHKA